MLVTESDMKPIKHEGVHLGSENCTEQKEVIFVKIDETFLQNHDKYNQNSRIKKYHIQTVDEHDNHIVIQSADIFELLAEVTTRELGLKTRSALEIREAVQEGLQITIVTTPCAEQPTSMELIGFSAIILREIQDFQLANCNSVLGIALGRYINRIITASRELSYVSNAWRANSKNTGALNILSMLYREIDSANVLPYKKRRPLVPITSVRYESMQNPQMARKLHRDITFGKNSILALSSDQLLNTNLSGYDNGKANCEQLSVFIPGQQQAEAELFFREYNMDDGNWPISDEVTGINWDVDWAVSLELELLNVSSFLADLGCEGGWIERFIGEIMAGIVTINYLFHSGFASEGARVGKISLQLARHYLSLPENPEIRPAAHFVVSSPVLPALMLKNLSNFFIGIASSYSFTGGLAQEEMRSQLIQQQLSQVSKCFQSEIRDFALNQIK